MSFSFSNNGQTLSIARNGVDAVNFIFDTDSFRIQGGDPILAANVDLIQVSGDSVPFDQINVREFDGHIVADLEAARDRVSINESGATTTFDIRTGGGDDTLSYFGGTGTLRGEDGNDQLFGGFGSALLDGGVGNDVLETRSANDTLIGGAGDDTIRVRDQIAEGFGGDGNDSLVGGHSELGDKLSGGTGNDTVFGGFGNDSLSGDEGDDLVQGGDGEDTLAAGAGDDTLTGGSDSDLFRIANGNTGTDIITDFLPGEDRIEILSGNTFQQLAITDVGNDVHIELSPSHTVILQGVQAADLSSDDFVGLASSAPSANRIIGTENGDTLLGFGQDAVIKGLGGNDRLAGKDGDDIVVGGAGNDTITGDQGNDRLSGGADEDTVLGGDGDDTIIAGAGNDQYHGDGGNDLIQTGGGDDRAFGGDGNDTIEATLGGDQILHGDAGNDLLRNDDARNNYEAILFGGDGDDTLIGDHAAKLFGGTGADVFIPLHELQIRDFSVAEDRIDVTGFNLDQTFSELFQTIHTAANGNVIIPVAPGIDVELFDIAASDLTAANFIGLNAETINEIQGTDAAETLTGTADEDNILAGGGGDLVNAGAGNDQLRGGDGNDTLNGEAGDDVVLGDAGDDLADGGDGRDRVEGGEGDDTLAGGADRDTVKGGAGDDDVRGGDGSDTLEGQDGADTLHGEGNSDLIEAGDGNDIAFGGVERDTLRGDRGEDSLFGGDEQDLLQGGLDNDLLDGGDDFDRLLGEDGDDTLVGGNGNDQIFGGNGADLAFGGAGNDLFRDISPVPGGPLDTVTGGSGDDTFGARDKVIEDFTIGDDVLDIRIHSDGAHIRGDVTITEIAQHPDGTRIAFDDGSICILRGITATDLSASDFLSLSGTVTLPQPVTKSTALFGPVGTEGTDSLLGTDGDDSVDGLGGDDSIFGADGDDTISGGTGDDSLRGDDGTDALFGGSGRDTLVANQGEDTVEGGVGGDVIAIGSGGPHIVTGGADGDLFDIRAGNTEVTITDFDPALDRIGVTGLQGHGAQRLADYDLTDTPDGLRIHIDPNVEILLPGLIATDISEASFLGLDLAPDGDQNLQGTADADHIVGGNEDDWIEGKEGNDRLAGGGGQNFVFGGAGDDTLISSTEDIDRLTGGSGADQFVINIGNRQDVIRDFTPGEDKIDLSAFGFENGFQDLTLIDFDASTAGISASGLQLTLFNISSSALSADDFIFDAPPPAPTNGDDNLIDRDGDAFLFLLDGDDTLTTSAGDDSVFGGRDNDLITAIGADERNLLLAGDFGDDTITIRDGVTGTSSIIGGNGADSLTGGGGVDLVFGGAGNDTLTGGSGQHDKLTGGDGADAFVVRPGNGDDIIRDFAPGVDKIDLTALNLSVTFQQLDIQAIGGNTHIDLGNGDSLTLYHTAPGDLSAGDFLGLQEILATEGADDLLGTDAADTIDGLGGPDTIGGQQGDDSIIGGAGADQLRGGKGNDTLLGGIGTDRLRGDLGDDLLDGGEGTFDVADFFNAQGSIVADLAAGTATGAGNDTLQNIERLEGGDFDDTLSGDAGDNVLAGAGGDDRMDGRDGNDLFGIDVGTGNDTVIGGNGDDRLLLVNQAGGDLDLQLKAGRLTIGSQTITVDGIETLDIDNQGDTNLIFDAEPFSHVILDGGNDTYTANRDGTTGHSVDAGAGDDTVRTLNQNDSVDGGAGDDLIVGNNGRDTLIGGAGNDTLIANRDDGDELFGGDGDDRIAGGRGSESLFGGDGVDTITSGFNSSADHIDAGNGDDFVTVTGAQSTVLLGAGDDFISVSADNVTVSGGDGNDLMVVSFQDAVVDGGAGADLIRLIGDDHTVRGGAGDDTIIGNGDTAQFIQAHDGMDLDRVTLFETHVDKIDVSGLSTGLRFEDLNLTDEASNLLIDFGNDDRLQIDDFSAADLLATDFIGLLPSPAPGPAPATEGADDLRGTEAADTIDGLGGPDTIIGNGGDDSLIGNRGADTLSGGDGNDTLLGGIGTDRLQGDQGDDLLDGGEGDFDVADFESAQGAIIADLAAGTASGDGNDTLQNIERLEGSDFDDTLSGDAGDNVLAGADGDDLVDGRAGNDLFGIDIGSGNDTVIGGADDDRLLLVDKDNADITVRLGTGSVIAPAGQRLDVDGVETLELRSDGHITAINYGDLFEAVQLNDGRGTYWGNASDEQVTGGAGRDVIFGGAGADTLDGGAGLHDKLTGGDGADVFVVRAGNGSDIIRDFAPGVDRIDLTALGLNATFDDLDITDTGANTRIDLGGGDVLTLYNTDPGDLSADDFIGLPVTAATEGDDNLVGTNDADTIDGLGGDDTVEGGTGRDTLTGGAGNDSLTDQSGNSLIFGGDGNDFLQASRNDDTLFGGAGDDTLSVFGGLNELTGGEGADTYVVARLGGQRILGFELAHDRIDVSALQLTDRFEDLDISSSGGVTRVNLRHGGNIVLEGVVGGEGETLNASHFIGLEAPAVIPNGREVFFYNEGDGVLEIDGFDPAIDRVDFRGFTSDLDALDLTFTVVGDDLLAEFEPGVGFLFKDTDAGDLSIANFIAKRHSTLSRRLGSEKAETLDAGDESGILGFGGDDVLTGNDGFEQVGGGAGNDTLFAKGNRDFLFGGEGDDRLVSGLGPANLFGNEGNDVLIGGLAHDDLNAGTGNDTLFGGGGGDDIYSFFPGSGVNTIMDFQTDGDRLQLLKYRFDKTFDELNISSTAPDANGLSDVTVNLGGGDLVILKSIVAADFTFRNVIGLDLPDDVPQGEAASIFGLRESEVIQDREISEIIDGFLGDDTILSSSGSDILKGGGGDDVIVATDDGVSFDFDILFGGEGDDTLTGGTGHAEFYGGKGEDVFTAAGPVREDQVIMDYEVGVDSIDVAALNVSFDDLTIEQTAADNVRLSAGDWRVDVRNVSVSDMTEDEFIGLI